MSKRLAREMREHRRKQAHERLETLIQQGRGLASLQQWQRRPKHKMHITGMLGVIGNVVHSREEIAEVFATFYEALRKAIVTETVAPEPRRPNEQVWPSVTVGEVKASVALLKAGKACAEDNLDAEDRQCRFACGNGVSVQFAV